MTEVTQVVQGPDGTTVWLSFDTTKKEIVVTYPSAYSIRTLPQERSTTNRKRKRETNGSKKEAKRIKEDEIVEMYVLPAELHQMILLYLPVEQVARCALVSKAWKSVIDDDTLWRQLFVLHFGDTTETEKRDNLWKKRCLCCVRLLNLCETDYGGGRSIILHWAMQKGLSGLATQLMRTYYGLCLTNVSAEMAIQTRQLAVLKAIPLSTYERHLSNLLMRAIILNDMAAVNHLTSGERTASYRLILDPHALYYASIHANLEMVQFCLSYWSTVVPKELSANDAICAAINGGNAEVLGAVLKAIRNLPQTRYLYYCFKAALSTNRRDMADQLIAAGLRLIEPGSEFYFERLVMERVEEGDIEGLKWLMSRTSFDLHTRKPVDPAFLAVDNAKVEFLSLLLAWGVDPDSFKNCYEEDSDEDNKADGDEEKSDEDTEKEEDEEEIVWPASTLLQRTIAQPTTAAQLAMVKLLLDAGASPNLRNHSRNDTPLILAVKNGHAEITKLLIRHKLTDINATNGEDETALSLAMRDGKKEMLDILLEREFKEKEKEKQKEEKKEKDKEKEGKEKEIEKEEVMRHAHAHHSLNKAWYYGVRRSKGDASYQPYVDILHELGAKKGGILQYYKRK